MHCVAVVVLFKIGAKTALDGAVIAIEDGPDLLSRAARGCPSAVFGKNMADRVKFHELELRGTASRLSSVSGS